MFVFFAFQVYVRVNKEAENNEDMKQAARDFFRQLEQHESHVVSLWQQFRDITVKEYQDIYEVRKLPGILVTAWVSKDRNLKWEIKMFNSWLPWSTTEIDLKSLQRLGVHFDVYSGESFHQDQAQEVVQQLQSRGLLKTSEYVATFDW